MNGDYGILALEKCSQLEQRLKQLEKTTTQLRLKTLVFEGNYSGCTQAEYTAEFSVNRDGDVFVRVDADLSAVTNGTLTLYVDSEEYKQISFSSNHVSAIIHDAFTSGVCSVIVKISGQTAFDAAVCCEVFGNVDYIEKDCRMDVVNAQNYSVVIYREDGVVKLYKYSGGALNLTEVITAQKASACIYQSGFFLLKINSDKMLTATYYAENMSQSFSVEIDNSVSDCFMTCENYPVAYYIKNGKLNKCVITSQTTKTCEDLNIFARSAAGIYDSGKTYIALEDKNRLNRLYVL